MGEIALTGLEAFFEIDWAASLREPQWSIPTGILFGLYGLRKIVLAFRKRSRFGEFPFNKGMGISCTYFGALNASIFLFIAFLFLEAGTEIGFAIGTVNDRIRHYAEAGFVFATLAGAVSLSLVLWVYTGVALRKEIGNRDARLTYLHNSLKARGFGHFDLIGLPVLALIFNIGPWALRILR